MATSLTASLISTPHTYEPLGVGNGGLWFQLSSNTASYATNFKYLFNLSSVDPYTGQVNNLGLYKVPPRPDATGLFSVAKSLRSVTSKDFDPFIIKEMPCTYSWVKYKVQYGVELNPGITYSSINNNGGFCQFNLGTSTSPLVGDYILISKDNTTINPQYNGYCTISSVQSGTQFTTTLPYATYSILPSYIETGDITDLNRYVGTSSYFYAYTGTKQYNEIGTDFGYLVMTNSGSQISNFLTTYNQYAITNLQGKSVYLNNFETIGAMVDPTTTTVSSIKYLFYTNPNDSIFNIWAQYTMTYSQNIDTKKIEIPVGPANLNQLGITMSMVDHYFVEVYSNTLGGLGLMLYKVVSNCSPYNNMRLAFANSMGSYDYWNFNWKNVQTTNIIRTPFRQTLPFNYGIGQRGDSTLSTQANDTYSISSDWLQDFDATFLKQLLISNDVYVVDELNNNYYPIVILDSSYTTQTKLNDKLYALNINFKYAYDINIYNQ